MKRKATQKRRRRSQTRERRLRRKNVPVPVVVRGDRVGDHATPSWDVILATRTTSAGRKGKGDVQKGMDAAAERPLAAPMGQSELFDMAILEPAG